MQSRPPITAHRFARLIAWLCAMLAWVAIGAPAHRQRKAYTLARLRRMTWQTIFIIAADYVRFEDRPVPRRYGPRRRKLVPMRALAGAWLRQRVRARGSVMAQARHLIAVLAKRHTLARAFAYRRRLPFTRLSPILPSAGSAEALRAICAIPTIANSS